MTWDEAAVGTLLFLLLIACEAAACAAMAVMLLSRVRRKRRETISRGRGFEVNLKSDRSVDHN